MRATSFIAARGSQPMLALRQVEERHHGAGLTARRIFGDDLLFDLLPCIRT
jgi:hypothetical protein